MDFLKSQIARIQLQLNGLSASQKMLTATLVTIMVMTLLWWGRYAGTAEMEPVLDQAFSSEDISRITMQLAARGIQYKVAGDKVLVPSDRKIEVLADLGYQQLLPRDTKNGFDEIVKQMSPWNSVDTNKQMWNRAKEMTLSQVIRNFPNVSNAAVIIDPTADRRIGTDLQPSATIDIQMRNNDKPAKKLVEAAADVVAGAQSGLARSRVKVIVNGASYSIHDKDADGSFESSDLIELVQQNERRFADKISSQLAFIQGVMVSVTVDVNTKSERRVEHTVDPKGISKVAEEENQTEESTSPVPSAGSNDPGAGANTGATVGAGNAAATPANTTTTEKNRTQYYNVYG
ncbi:MAG TPA: flagellar M-ring protein FliF C-terminal domain-containing protein, partial [Tepidisphaeraceae bacterium]